ncbi:hypothetical protein BLA50215_03476 [Burkholderia lata]|nr:hypothetical protein BLA50215_03476 [Burkholderia lata]
MSARSPACCCRCACCGDRLPARIQSPRCRTRVDPRPSPVCGATPCIEPGKCVCPARSMCGSPGRTRPGATHTGEIGRALHRRYPPPIRIDADRCGLRADRLARGSGHAGRDAVARRYRTGGRRMERCVRERAALLLYRQGRRPPECSSPVTRGNERAAPPGRSVPFSLVEMAKYANSCCFVAFHADDISRRDSAVAGDGSGHERREPARLPGSRGSVHATQRAARHAHGCRRGGVHHLDRRNMQS